LLEDFGTGPSIKLIAGYQQKAGTILDGVVHRGYTIREPSSGDWITHLQCGLPFKNDKEITIQSSKVNNANLLTHITNWVSQIMPEGTGVDDSGRFKIKRSKEYTGNLAGAVEEYNDNVTLNTTVGYHGAASKILNEISDKFGLLFYYDNEGLNVSKSVIEGKPIDLEISQDTGMIGSPQYTDTGAKVITYLNPQLKMFQSIRVKSDVLDKNVQILTLNHRGDTHTNDWLSEIDASNINNVISINNPGSGR
jgi:uncharacterized protein (DUF2164 family)